MSETLFSKIIDRSVPADIVYEDEHILGFKDIMPQAPIHVLFIPKIPIATHNDITPEHDQIMAQLHHAINAYAKQIGEDENGYRIVMNCNGNGQQTVFHIHMHFLAGRQLQWPPG